MPSIQEYAAFLQNAGQNAGGCPDGTQGVALGWYAVSLRDTRNVQRSTRDKTHASCLDLIRILRDEVVVYPELLPSQAKITET